VDRRLAQAGGCAIDKEKLNGAAEGFGCHATTSPVSASSSATINTPDRARSEAYYRDVLGLTFVADDGFAAVFELAGAVLRNTELEGFAAGPHPAPGWMVPDIVAEMQTLVARGVTPVIYEGFGQDILGIWTAPAGVAKVAWFNDPDGNVLSLTEAS